MNEFFSSELWKKLKNGQMPDLYVATEVYLYFSLAAILSGLIIIIAANYISKR
jgi:hypothetical protein